MKLEETGQTSQLQIGEATTAVEAPPGPQERAHSCLGGGGDDVCVMIMCLLDPPADTWPLNPEQIRRGAVFAWLCPQASATCPPSPEWMI